jgi:hypothetical protein
MSLTRLFMFLLHVVVVAGAIAAAAWVVARVAG